jgi:hypothetical protein
MAADKIFRNDIQPEFRNRNGRKKAQKAQNTGRGPGFVKKTPPLPGELKLQL